MHAPCTITQWARKAEKQLGTIFSLAYGTPCEALFLGRSASKVQGSEISFKVEDPGDSSELLVSLRGENDALLSHLFSNILLGIERFALAYFVFEVRGVSAGQQGLFGLYKRGSAGELLGTCEVTYLGQQESPAFTALPYITSFDARKESPVVQCSLSVFPRCTPVSLIRVRAFSPLAFDFWFQIIEGELSMVADPHPQPDPACSLEMGVIQLSLKEVLSLRPGDILELECPQTISGVLACENLPLTSVQIRLKEGKLELEVVQNLLLPSIAQDYFQRREKKKLLSDISD